MVRTLKPAEAYHLSPLVQQKTSNNVRLGMINNPSADVSAETTRVTRAIWSAMQTQTANNAKNFITKMAKEETAAALQKGVDVSEFAVGVRGLHTESKQDHGLVILVFLLLICPFVSCLQKYLFFSSGYGFVTV